MAHHIPRIQYQNLDTTCDTTIGLGVLNNIPDTTDIEIGMFARATGIPTGALVLSKTVNSVTLAASVLATASASVAVKFGKEILFDFPPEETTGENLTTNSTVSESLSGVRQVSINYLEVVRKLIFSFVSPTIYALLATFLEDWALQGEEFRYFDDQTSDTYTTVELNNFKVAPVKQFPKTQNSYIWQVPLDVRRVL